MDSNSFWLSKTMLPYDINVMKMVTVGDDHNAIINEARNMLQGQFNYLFVRIDVELTKSSIVTRGIE